MSSGSRVVIELPMIRSSEEEFRTSDAVSSELVSPVLDVAVVKGRGYELVINDESIVEDGMVVGC